MLEHLRRMYSLYRNHEMCATHVTELKDINVNHIEGEISQVFDGKNSIGFDRFTRRF
jgi:hypothetical protein